MKDASSHHDYEVGRVVDDNDTPQFKNTAALADDTTPYGTGRGLRGENEVRKLTRTPNIIFDETMHK